MTKPAAFNAALVTIERKRFSVTQGEVLLSYNGQKIEQYADSIVLTDGGYQGLTDAEWIAVARREALARGLATETKAAAKAADVEQNRRAAWNKGLSIATGHIFGRRDRHAADAAFAAGRTYDDYAAELASAEPVGKALHPRKVDAIESATKFATDRITKALEKLAAAGWDLNVLAPYPDSRRESRESYIAKRDLHNFYSMLTEQDPAHRNYQMHGPNIRRRSETGEARLINMAKQGAAFQYDKFICKMVGKIGEGATEATIEGNHVWGNSILTVTMANGTAQRWHTQQIWNVSCLGKDFPQWPSRLMK